MPAESDSRPTCSTFVPARTAVAVVGELSPAAVRVTLQDATGEPAPEIQPQEATETVAPTEARTIRPAGYSERYKSMAEKARNTEDNVTPTATKDSE